LNLQVTISRRHNYVWKKTTGDDGDDAGDSTAVDLASPPSVEGLGATGAWLLRKLDYVTTGHSQSSRSKLPSWKTEEFLSTIREAKQRHVEAGRFKHHLVSWDDGKHEHALGIPSGRGGRGLRARQMGSRPLPSCTAFLS
jgi:hypothetical protein